MITREETLKILQAAVELKGEDYVLPGTCQYFMKDQDQHEDILTEPACIVGVAFAYAGLGSLVLDDGALIEQNRKVQDLFTTNARRVLAIAQQCQDGRHPLCGTGEGNKRLDWGRAYAAAEFLTRDLEEDDYSMIESF